MILRRDKCLEKRVCNRHALDCVLSMDQKGKELRKMIDGRHPFLVVPQATGAMW